MAIILLLASDAYEFSWRYQLPALVLLPPAGILGAAVIITATRGTATKQAAAPELDDLPREAERSA